MDEPSGISIAHGQLQIIFKSELYCFTGKYSLIDDDTQMLSTSRLQFDFLVSIDNHHNLAIHTGDLKKVEALLEPAAVQRYVKFQLRLVTPQGLVKILSAEGKLFGVYKKTAAEWKKSEQDLLQAHDLLRTVFDASPHSISVYRILYNRRGDPEDFEILSLNAITVLTIGMRVDEVVGKRFGQLFPQFRDIGVFDKFKEVAATGVRADFEKWCEGSGLNHWLRFIVIRTGNLLVVTSEDITARRKAEEEIPVVSNHNLQFPQDSF
jgi:PAS domain-containing protein